MSSSNNSDSASKPVRGDVGLFKCPDCESIFKRRDHLGRHVMTQHSDGASHRTKCPFKDCDTEMVRRDHLRRHISQVHKVDPSDVLPYSRRKPFSKAVVDPLKRFKCVYDGCDAELSRKDHLCRHIKNIHKADPRQVIGHMYKQPRPGSAKETDSGGGSLSSTTVTTNGTPTSTGAGGTQVKGKKRGKRKKKEEKGEEATSQGTLTLEQGPGHLLLNHHHHSHPHPPPAHHSNQPHPSTLSDYDYALSYCQLFLK